MTEPIWVLTLVRQEVQYQDEPVTDLNDPAQAPRVTYRDDGQVAVPHGCVRSVRQFDGETFVVGIFGNEFHARGSWREFLAMYAAGSRVYHFPAPEGYVAEDLPTGSPVLGTDPPAG